MSHPPLRLLTPLSVAGLSMAVLTAAVVPATAMPIQFAQAISPISDTSNYGRQGDRFRATTVPVGINDVISGSVDVGTGNLNLKIKAVGFSFSKNSLDAVEKGPNVIDGWMASAAGTGHLVVNGSQIVWVTASGYEIPFTPVAGSTTTYTSVAQLRASLIKTTAGWDMRQWDSNAVTSFNNDGSPIRIKDRNGNISTLTNNGTIPASITGWSGPVAARTANLTRNGAITETSVSTMKMTLSSTNGRIDKITTLNGSITTITYNAEGRVSSIQAPATGKVSFAYDASGKVTSFTRANATSGDQTTRFDYTTGNQTLVVDGSTDQSKAVSTVPHVTYSLITGQVVNAARDADGRLVSRTFTPNMSVASSTVGEGSSAATTTNAFAANNGYSQTGSASPTGAASSAGYTNTSDASKYSPTTTTDSNGVKGTYTYSAAGNMESSTNALAAEARLTYNADGTVATATAPGQAGNPTKYTYNADHQLITVTPNTGGSLKAESYAYDALGRISVRTNGRGQKIAYTYDAASRLAKVSYSDGTTPVAYEYNERNQVTKRTDASGTSSWTYDEQGRIASRMNSAAASTITYTYDKAGRLSGKSNDGKLNSTYVYTPGGKLTSLKYNDGTGTKAVQFKYDSLGRRTDTIYGINTDASQWTAWNTTAYDASGKPVRVTIKNKPTGTTAAVTVVDTSYCYIAGTTAPGGCTANPANDRTKVQWAKDNLTGTYNTYAYDTAGRLIQAKTNGGTNTNYVYTYDIRGNRLSGTQYKAATVNSTYSAQNQLTNAGWAYDADGNTISEALNTATYNAANQMTSVYQKSQAKTFTYKYAGTNQTEMVSQTSPTGTYTYSYGRSSQHGTPVIEKVIKDGAAAYIEQDPSTGKPLFIRTSDGQINEYATDATTQEMILLTQSGEQAQAKMYDPFGVRVVNTKTDTRIDLENPYAYRFGLFDKTTGRYRYGARQYNPTMAVWAERDALDSPLDHANANRYAYAGQDPVNNYDPTGLITMDIGVDGCIPIVCVGGGIKKDDSEGSEWHPYFNIGVGAEAGASGGVSFDSGDVSSDSDEVVGSCRMNALIGGELSVSGNLESPTDAPNIGGGMSFGVGGGCDVRYEHTF